MHTLRAVRYAQFGIPVFWAALDSVCMRWRRPCHPLHAGLVALLCKVQATEDVRNLLHRRIYCGRTRVAVVCHRGTNIKRFFLPTLAQSVSFVAFFCGCFFPTTTEENVILLQRPGHGLEEISGQDQIAWVVHGRAVVLCLLLDKIKKSLCSLRNWDIEDRNNFLHSMISDQK